MTKPASPRRRHPAARARAIAAVVSAAAFGSLTGVIALTQTGGAATPATTKAAATASSRATTSASSSSSSGVNLAPSSGSPAVTSTHGS